MSRSQSLQKTCSNYYYTSLEQKVYQNKALVEPLERVPSSISLFLLLLPTTQGSEVQRHQCFR